MNVFVADPMVLEDIAVSDPVEVDGRETQATAESLFGAIGLNATTLAEPLPEELGAEPAAHIH